MSFFMPLFQGLAMKLLGLLVSYLEANALQMMFDGIDEMVETALGGAEKSALVAQNEKEERRLSVLRKYFEGWKSFVQEKK